MVREVRGRYLRLRITMHGDGRHSPAIFRLRVQYPRFSWQTHTSPSISSSRSVRFASGKANQAEANGADFRAASAGEFRGLLTPIEDRIAAAEILLDRGRARGAPARPRRDARHRCRPTGRKHAAGAGWARRVRFSRATAATGGLLLALRHPHRWSGGAGRGDPGRALPPAPHDGDDPRVGTWMTATTR